ncbi:NAD(P)-dependent oxidoreductase [Bacillus sp. ISL-47]|uniref:NAD(P)-dependent oxidoreductase n=1 Tax=Bacillus sp. ISL-47 TaxID=2819130 RepID=UPI001BE9758E|nr:NAD(P)-dependent oxidoreductase [Bacillus sp. ISL-47]MBT2687408.1 NAD(P)-dependent oxidoreductase [Bacillus sp. ISL-47]MBT2707130.1 NAD(P)-dependent oxidoreductase [Pseudomonas sp. ISL-84]
MKHIGVIGCGAMGKGIVKNLLKNGYKVYAYDPSADALAKCEELGAIPQPSPFELGRQADLVISSLPGPGIVRDVMMGESGVFAALKPRSFVLDMSTIDPATAQELYSAAKEREVHFYDCPLSGGPKGADAGTLTIMVGGDDRYIAEIRPVLESVGKDIFLLGSSGSGQVAKLCHNMLVALITAGLGEAFAVGEKAGVSRTQLAEVIQSGSAHNRVMSVFGENILNGTYENVLFSLEHMNKDIHLYKETAEHYSADSPLGQMVCSLYKKAMEQGKAQLDSSAICEGI